jgi:hypothetical protein
MSLVRSGSIRELEDWHARVGSKQDSTISLNTALSAS